MPFPQYGWSRNRQQRTTENRYHNEFVKKGWRKNPKYQGNKMKQNSSRERYKWQKKTVLISKMIIDLVSLHQETQ